MTLCLNADDSLVVSLADSLENPCLYFGVDEGEATIASEEKSDALYCIRCRHKYSYGYKTYGHLDDQLADGEDVSWIWDVPFENLAAHERLIGNVYTAGRRRGDMYLRLKYAGFTPAKLKEIKDDRSFAAKLECRTRPLFILPTYSAMMRLRPVLAKKIRSKDFWE